MQTPFLSVVPQRHTMDCSVAVLAMLLGKSYEETLMAFDYNVMREGATIRQVKAAAKYLGVTLNWSRKIPDLETETGILAVKSPKWPSDHLVVLKDGLIVDTDATIWDQDVFMAAYEAKPISIMTVEKE
jgi:ABC-type bacteriocin/lantibiotic exporter with double-glycine peptidase domain